MLTEYKSLTFNLTSSHFLHLKYERRKKAGSQKTNQ